MTGISAADRAEAARTLTAIAAAFPDSRATVMLAAAADSLTRGANPDTAIARATAAGSRWTPAGSTPRSRQEPRRQPKRTRRR